MRVLMALGWLGLWAVPLIAAACYSRLSDECLYETPTLRNLVLRLGRARYRSAVGICEQVKELSGPNK